MEIQGYPSYTILAVLSVGLLLGVWRPYLGFLFAVLLMTAGHVTMFNQTRTPSLGPYFNLTDACMLVAIVAFFLDKFHRAEPVWLPRVVLLMLLVVTTAALQSLWKFDWSYESIRAFRWALQTPVAIFLGGNMVTTADRAKKLVVVLLAGALLASVQHVAFAANIWRTRSLDMRTYQGMRTISFWAGCMPSAFLVSAVLWERPRRLMVWVLYLGVGLLLLASLFLNQTRSLWIGTVVAALAVVGLFRGGDQWRRVTRAGIDLALVLVVAAFVCRHFLPGLDVGGIIVDRADRLFHDEAHMGTRERAFAIETAQWFEGSLVFGRGLFFFQTIRNPQAASEHIAFGHLGYVTYLSQLGVLGFCVYGILLPVGVLRSSTHLWRKGDGPVMRCSALLAGSSVICLSVMFVASSHFLALGYEAPAVLYGTVWGLARAVGHDCMTPVSTQCF